MPCGWEGNRRSGVTLAMRHKLHWFIHLRTQDLRKGDEHPAYTPHGVWHTFTFYVEYVACRQLWTCQGCPAKSVPSLGGLVPPPNIRLIGLTRVNTPNSILIGSSVLAQIMFVSNRYTAGHTRAHADHVTSVATGRIVTLRACNVV